MSPPVGVAVSGVPKPKPTAVAPPTTLPQDQGQATAPEAGGDLNDLFAQADSMKGAGGTNDSASNASATPPATPPSAGVSNPAPTAPPSPNDDVSGLFDQADALKAGGTAPGQEIDENAPGANLKGQVMGAIGRSPEEQRRMLSKALGDGFETKLGGKDGEEVLFKKDGDKKFARMDPGFWHNALNFAEEHAKSLVGTGDPKKYIDSAGELSKSLAAIATKHGISMASALGGEIIGAWGGGAAASATLGPEAAPGGAIAGGIIGSAAGGVVDTYARGALVRAAGVEPAVDERKEAAFNALINGTAAGAAVALKGPIKSAVAKITSMLEDTPLANVMRLSKVREGVEELSQELGHSAPPNAALGSNVSSALDSIKDQLGEAVGTVNQKALAVAGPKTFKVPGYQQKLTELLQGEGVSINPNGIAEIPAGLEATKPFGAPEGMTALKDLVQDYNQLAKNNGAMNLKTLTNTMSYYKDPAGFESRLPSSVNGAYKTLREALGTERDQILPQVLDGTPEGEFVKSAFENYSNKIDGIRDLQSMALRKGSPEKFAEALIRPKDSAGVQQLKGIFGEDSPQFSSIRSAWFSGIASKAIDPETGAISGGEIKRAMAKYGPDVLNELLTPGQQNALTLLANNAEKVSYRGLINNPENNDFLRRMVGAYAKGGKTEAISRFMVDAFAGNKAAMDYMSNEGLLKLARETSDPEGRSALIKAGQWLQRVINVSDVVVNKDGSKRYLVPVLAPTMSALINAHERDKNSEDMPQWLRRRNDSIGAMKTGSK